MFLYLHIIYINVLFWSELRRYRAININFELIKHKSNNNNNNDEKSFMKSDAEKSTQYNPHVSEPLPFLLRGSHMRSTIRKTGFKYGAKTAVVCKLDIASQLVSTYKVFRARSEKTGFVEGTPPHPRWRP